MGLLKQLGLKPVVGRQPVVSSPSSRTSSTPSGAALPAVVLDGMPDDDGSKKAAAPPRSDFRDRDPGNTMGATYYPTPYGELFYFQEHVEKGIVARFQQAVSAMTQLRAEVKTLRGVVATETTALKPLQPYLQSADRLKQEIAGSASPSAVSQAETAEGSKNAVNTLLLLLRDFKGRLEDAQGQWQMALDELTIMQKHEGATKLAAQAAAQEKVLVTFLSMTGTAITATIAISATGGIGAVRPAYDAVNTLWALFRDNDIADSAARLERDAKAMEARSVADHIANARSSFDHVKAMIEDAHDTAETVNRDFDRQRNRAETEFDKTARTPFRFALIGTALAAVQARSEAANRVERAGSAVCNAIDEINKIFGDSGSELFNHKVTAKMRDEGFNALQAALRMMEEAKARLASLGTLRKTALDALVTSPGK